MTYIPNRNINEDFDKRHPKMERFLFSFVRITLYASVVIIAILSTFRSTGRCTW